MVSSQRGPKLEEGWIKAIEKEATLRALWFKRNEARLNEIANQEPLRKVPDEDKNKIKADRIAAFQNATKYKRRKTDDFVTDSNTVEFPLELMKPVDPAINKLIYTGSHKDGRINYLRERIKSLPEDRFYFPECSSWEYGWHMYDKIKKIKKTGFGRQQVIKDTFYRRRTGISIDPEWYREPATISPTFCNTCMH